MEEDSLDLALLSADKLTASGSSPLAKGSSHTTSMPTLPSSGTSSMSPSAVGGAVGSSTLRGAAVLGMLDDPAVARKPIALDSAAAPPKAAEESPLRSSSLAAASRGMFDPLSSVSSPVADAAAMTAKLSDSIDDGLRRSSPALRAASLDVTDSPASLSPTAAAVAVPAPATAASATGASSAAVEEKKSVDDLLAELMSEELAGGSAAPPAAARTPSAARAPAAEVPAARRVAVRSGAADEAWSVAAATRRSTNDDLQNQLRSCVKQLADGLAADASASAAASSMRRSLRAAAERLSAAAGGDTPALVSFLLSCAHALSALSDVAAAIGGRRPVQVVHDALLSAACALREGDGAAAAPLARAFLAAIVSDMPADGLADAFVAARASATPMLDAAAASRWLHSVHFSPAALPAARAVLLISLQAADAAEDDANAALQLSAEQPPTFLVLPGGDYTLTVRLATADRAAGAAAVLSGSAAFTLTSGDGSAAATAAASAIVVPSLHAAADGLSASSALRCPAELPRDSVLQGAIVAVVRMGGSEDDVTAARFPFSLRLLKPGGRRRALLGDDALTAAAEQLPAWAAAIGVPADGCLPMRLL
eukprot:PLAT6395.3.p1 GENE.PLAT6395.3~~PLAT6395.3.p1  ORF type:complete len:597 (-),score=251.10 PLAT6395.3:105-1895(-)